MVMSVGGAEPPTAWQNGGPQMASGTRGLARAVSRPATARPAHPGRRPASGQPPRFRLSVLAMPAVLVLIGLVVAGLGQRAVPAGAPHLAWALSPSSNTVTIRLTPGDGHASRQILARSQLMVSEDGNGRLRRHSPGR